MSSRSFNTRRRLFIWSPVLLAYTAFVCTGLALWMLYGTFWRQQEQLLTQQVDEQVRLLETIGGSNNWDREKTLKDFVEFNAKHSRLGATSECTLACRDGDGLRFLFRKHPDALSRLPASSDTALAEPMRKALEGKTGTLVGKDYRGIEVLAAYAPVPKWNWGIVVKIDTSELRSPLLTTAVVAISVAMLLVIGGSLLIVQLGRPLIRDIEQSHERLGLAIRGASNGLWDWPDVTKNEQWWSPKLYELVGYATDEVMPSFSQFKAFLHPDDVDRLVAAVDAHLNQHIPHDIECRLRTKSGEYRWFRGRAKAVWDAEGNPIRMSGSIEDIDKQKQAEWRRLRSISRLEAVNRLHEALLLPEHMEQKFQRITELAVESLNLDFCRIWMIKKADLCEAGCIHASVTDGPHQCQHRDRCLHLVSSSGRYTHIDGGHRRVPIGAYKIGRIASGSEKQFLTNDVAHEPRIGDPEWASLLGLVSFVGYKLRDANGRPIGVLAGFAQHAIDEEDDAFLLNLAETTSVVILSSEAQQELIQAQQAAESANRAKGEFLANMSHEIRTPMTAILGFADILAGTVIDKEAVEAIQIIRRNGDHLLQIINDILDLSKIESNKCKIGQIACSPHQVVTEVVSLMKVPANAKGLSLTLEVGSDIPEKITTDPIRLRQILVNLIGNALKFTEIGGVQVIMQLDARGDEPKLRFDVIDTGIGLSEEQISRLFQPFSQADTSTNRCYGGSGLGLAISKRLAEMLGGDLTVTSVFGKGSTFRVSIATRSMDGAKLIDQPSEAAQYTPYALHSEIRLDGCILLAEDGPDNQRLIAHILQKAGAEVVVAENGQVAFALALAAWQAGNPFDVILMDMQMPVVDGYQATRELRSIGYGGPIIALTAHAMMEDRQKCLDAGCNNYTTKPIDRAVLLECVAKHLAPGPVPN
ncbi:MAG: ATP-binding protein [Thermoguttaceae bacterium]